MSGASSVEQLRPGDHACLTFSDPEERLDIVAAFVRDGLRAGEKVICLTEAVAETVLSEELTRRGLGVSSATSSGRLQVAGCGPFFVPQGTFDAKRTIRSLQDEIVQARREGFQGLRVTSDMCWALRPVSGLADLMAYESQFTSMLAAENATAVCQYDRQCFDTVTIATAVDAHGLTVAAVTYHDDALLRICRQYVPPGVRVAGEIDYRAVEPLSRSLSEALAIDDHIDVNLTQLRFIDGAAAGVLAQAALGLTGPQRMTIRCQRMAYHVLDALGVRQIGGVTMVAVDDGR